ncbi:MAG TPA: DNA polymerase III subunit delta [Burkholderiales bacterium]|nr:DNA polymerase III subunit delta [Burkholderiales bacterium]
MPLGPDQLPAQLKRGIAPLYFIFGDEPLLIDEAVQALREAAASAQFEREVVNVEPGFDWNAFYASLQSGSLFSTRRLVELRLPTGKPGDAGGKILTELAQTPSNDVVLLVRCGKLDRAVRATKWAKAFETAAVTVQVYPLETSQLPGWIARRMRAAGLAPGAGVAERLAYHVEGNLLAGAQEIEKLAMQFGTGEIGLDDIEGVLGDNARYSVYALADACLRGARADCVRILRNLKAEGEAPALVCWSLVREIRILARLAGEIAAGGKLEQVLDAHRDLVWAKRRVFVTQALKRGNVKTWRALLQQAARVDRVVKGRAAGEPWQALESLALAMGGIRLASAV